MCDPEVCGTLCQGLNLLVLVGFAAYLVGTMGWSLWRSWKEIGEGEEGSHGWRPTRQPGCAAQRGRGRQRIMTTCAHGP